MSEVFTSEGPVPDARDEVARLEAEIDALAEAAAQCRKLMLMGKAAVVLGGSLLPLAALKLLGLGAQALLMAIAAVLGGIVLQGSNKRTLDECADRLRQHEACRSALIDSLSLREVRA